MRICSLLPSATEMVYALGLGDDLVGVSYACDYPDEAASLPVVSHSLRNIKHLDSGQIDALVQQARANNNPMYWIDEELLADLRPDLIITQELCEVCAIASGSVFETAAKVLDYQPEILTIRPSGVDDILQNVTNLANAAGVPERGSDLRGSLEARIRHVTDGVLRQAQDDRFDGRRPRVVCLDWLDPLRNTGQWLPEISEMAGGEEGLAVPRGQSRELSWEEVRDYCTRVPDDHALRLRAGTVAAGGERQADGAAGLGGASRCAQRAGLRIRRARAQPTRAAGSRRAGRAGGSVASRQVCWPGA